MAEAALVIINTGGHAGLLTAHNTIHTYTYTQKHNWVIMFVQTVKRRFPES